MADLRAVAVPATQAFPTDIGDGDRILVGALGRDTGGVVDLYTDDNSTTITIGGGSSQTSTTIKAGATADIVLMSRGGSVTVSEDGQTSLAAGFAATSLIGAINEVLGESGSISSNLICFPAISDVGTGDAANFMAIPLKMSGWVLTRATAQVVTAGETNPTEIQVRRRRSGSDVDMLSGKVSIASLGTIATPGTIDTGNDDVQTDDMIFIDIDAVSSTPPKGLTVVLEFAK